MGLLLSAGLALGACTTGTDADQADGDEPTIGSAPVEDEAMSDSGSDSGDVDGDSSIGSEAIVTQSGSIDETEPDLAMVVDREMSEGSAEEPTVEDNPEIDEEGTIEVPQADLGATESVLCASIQMGLDAVRDGASDMVAEHKSRLLDGLDSVADSRLSGLIEDIDDQSMSETLLSGALDRCEDLGYLS